MTLFVLAELLFISLHVEKNIKRDKDQKKKRQIQKTESRFFNLQICDIFGIGKNIQKNQKLLGHF